MRIQSGQLIGLGYGRYVRSDEVVALEPITEGRGPGRRCLVWVRGVPDPFVASRSQAAIMRDMSTPPEGSRNAPAPPPRRLPQRASRAASASKVRSAATRSRPAARAANAKPAPARRRPH